MSSYYYRSMNFPLRQEVPAHVVSILAAVASDDPPRQTDLDRIHPVPRWYLSDWRRLVGGYELEPHFGSPIRLAHSNSSAPPSRVVPRLSIEWTLHDDEYANGGYMFELWVQNLAHRPDPLLGTASNRVTIGWRALNPNDYDAQILYMDEHGFSAGDGPVTTYQEFDEAWAQMAADDWELWFE